jgi:hypothetical protein
MFQSRNNTLVAVITRYVSFCYHHSPGQACNNWTFHIYGPCLHDEMTPSDAEIILDDHGPLWTMGNNQFGQLWKMIEKSKIVATNFFQIPTQFVYGRFEANIPEGPRWTFLNSNRIRGARLVKPVTQHNRFSECCSYAHRSAVNVQHQVERLWMPTD